SPGQQFIKIVNDELINMMGKENHGLVQKSNELTVVMMVGLQGSGKTTTAAKLANLLKKSGKKVMLSSADIYRPAAIEQLRVLAESIEVPCHDSKEDMAPLEISKSSVQKANETFCDYLILDTAGRLQIDEKLMGELRDIKSHIRLHEIIFVADAMTGQDAVNVAKSFHEQLEISGFILTKMDGDARGGAALSIRAITGQPVKFIGRGEKIGDLEPFFPERIASRILGMGDLVGLIEKTQEHFDKNKAASLENKLRKNQFTLTDFQEQLRQIKKMGSIKDLLGMIPGQAKKLPQNANIDESAITRIDAIISSMTIKEKENPTIINGARKARVAKGSGTNVHEINKLLKQFEQMRKMMKKFSLMGKDKKSMRNLQNMFSQGNMSPF
ncbi:MAG: signal recognition particle protein, partial [Deltaproteobacteria bacterium]|nr:signal recognition particle protein [Deltaproteobacteria bacterium]